VRKSESTPAPISYWCQWCGSRTGDLTNTGSIFARNTAQLVADNINNFGGRIHGDSVVASAKTDINNTAGTHRRRPQVDCDGGPRYQHRDGHPQCLV
jgi:hypothetical protein